MKFAFFYKTRKEYHRVFEYVQAINKEKKESPKLRNRELLKIHTRYLSTKNNKWETSVPIRRKGEKKYLGVVIGNKRLLKRFGVYPERFMEYAGIELVPKNSNVPNHIDERTTHKMTITSYQEFKTITSVFNKRYGHGAWKIRGPAKLQHTLKELDNQKSEDITNFFSIFSSEDLVRKYPNGIPVTLVVNEPEANITKQLFKVVLKG